MLGFGDSRAALCATGARVGGTKRREPFLKLGSMNEKDCQVCGACCVSGHPNASWYILDKRGNESTYIPTKKNSQGLTVCQHLEGVIGERVWCAIYDDRPSVCSDFKIDGMWCRSARDEVSWLV